MGRNHTKKILKVLSFEPGKHYILKFQVGTLHPKQLEYFLESCQKWKIFIHCLPCYDLDKVKFEQEERWEKAIHQDL